MNRVFRIVWNPSHQAWAVASELAASAGKPTTSTASAPLSSSVLPVRARVHGLQAAVAATLLAFAGAAAADCTTSGLAITCAPPTPQQTTVGTGPGTPSGTSVDVQQNALVSTGGQTAISVGDNASIRVRSGATVQNSAPSNAGGYFGTGPNTVEFGNGTTLTIEQGAQVLSNGTADYAEAINPIGAGNTIINNGTVSSQAGGAAIWFQSSSGTNAVVNGATGLIQYKDGTTGSVIGFSGSSALNFTNQGRVVGPMSFANGNDTLNLYDGSSISGAIDGGGGNNLLTLNGTGAGIFNQSLSNFQTLVKNDSGSWTFASSLQGAGITSTRVAGGTLVLGADASNYTGSMTVDPAGTLQTSGEFAPLAITDNGLVRFAQPTDATYAGLLSGSGSVEKTGAGRLTLTGNNGYAGGTTISGGTLQVSSDGNLGAATGGLTFNGGTLELAGPIHASRAITMAQAGTIDVAGTRGSTLSGSLGGAGTLTLVNSAPYDFAGGINRLSLGSSNNSGFSGSIQLGLPGPADGLAGRLNVEVTGTGTLGTSGNRVDIYNNSELDFNGAGASAGNLNITTHVSTNWLGTNSGVTFANGASAGSAVMTNDAVGSLIQFQTGTTAANATINNGSGARVYFEGNSTGGSARIDNAGGRVYLQDSADLSGATVANGAGGNVFINNAATGISIGQLSGDGNVVLGSKTLTVGALGTSATVGGVISDTGPGFVDVQGTPYNTPVMDTGGSLVKIGAGTLTLGGANTYTGSTTVAAGTLKAGVAGTFSAASAHTVAAGATLDTAGLDQTVASLQNAGTVSLRGAAAGSTLTVKGAYVGRNGVLSLGTVLGDSSSLSDRLVLNGPTASASGSTTVRITNLGGLGAQTSGNGIEVVSAWNGATTTAQTTRDAFSLANGHLDAGAFEYRLYAADAQGAGQNWYLRSETTVQPPVPPGKPDIGNPALPPGSQTPPASVVPPLTVPTYRAEVPLFAALPAQLRQADLAMLGNLHRRVGDESAPTTGDAGGGRQAWARAVYADLDIRQDGVAAAQSTGHVSGLQAGTDLLAGGNWRAGVYVGYLDGGADVSGNAHGTLGRVGGNDLQSRYLGGYATWMDGSGLYADAVLQGASHRYTVRPDGNPSAPGKADSTTASIETGKSFPLAEGWRIEPQAQIVYQRGRFDDVLISGAAVRQDADGGWIGRLGVRVKGDIATSAGRLQPYGRVNVYCATSGTDVATFIAPAASTSLASATGYTSTEVAAGLTLALTPAATLYGEVGQLFSSGGDARVKSSVQGSVGLRLGW